MISESYVRILYRLLLNRDPENDTVVTQHAQSADDELAFLRDVVASPEYQGMRSHSLSIGRLLHPQHIPVETTAAPADLRVMLDGIAQKWREFGETEPHWSVLVSENYLQSKLDEHIDEFYASGDEVSEVVLAAVKRAGIDPSSLKTVADFGCGVGRLTLALAGRFGHVTGIDISPAHIRLARDRAQQTGIGNVDFCAISDIDDIHAVDKVDFLISIIVLQHNPPPIMAKIVETLLSLLNPGGLAYLQIPTYIERYSFNVENYLAEDKVDMEMNYLPQKDIFRMIHAGNCIALEVREDGWTGAEDVISHTFLIQKNPVG